MAADLLDRIAGRIEINPKQTALLGEIRRLLAEGEPAKIGRVQALAETTAGQEVARRARDLRRTRQSHERSDRPTDQRRH